MSNKKTIEDGALTREQAIAKAAEILHTPREICPEDDWKCIAPNWDLNLFYDEIAGKCRAVLYPIENGQTVISRPTIVE